MGMEEHGEDGGEVDNLYHLMCRLPLLDNLYFSMQAMNVGIVDLHLMDLEHDLLALYMEIERTPVAEATLVSALSQMWIFAIYELLRTWRQHAKEIIEYGDRLRGANHDERGKLINQKLEALKKAGALSIDGGEFYQSPFKEVETDDELLKALKAALERIELPFRNLDFVRVTLAKHEVPKTKGIFAQAPGYGRISMENGSITWNIALKDNSYMVCSRREIADAFRVACKGIPSPWDDAAA